MACRYRMWLALAAALAGGVVEAQTTLPPATACKTGGFTVLRFGGRDVRGKADGNFSVFFESPDYENNSFDQALRSAMSNWSAVSGSGWRFNFAGYSASGGAGGDGVLKVSRGGTSLPTGVLAATLISASATTGRILDADIYVSTAVNYTVDGSEFDFESVLLHEFGHSLGLDHNDRCSGTRTVMHSTIGRGVVERDLFAAEVEGVRFLYSGASSGGGGEGGDTVALSPSALLFSGVAGGATPPGQTLVISAVAGAVWSAGTFTTRGGSWLGVTPASGAGPGLATVTVNATGLPAGFYVGRVAVTSGGSTREVSASLNLSAPAVTGLDLSPATLAFSAVAGATAPGSQTVGLSGTPGQAWSATASTTAGGNWLRVAAGSGTLPALLSVSVLPVGLAPGTYSGKATVVSGGITREAAVQMEVAALPQLVIEPSQVGLTSRVGSTLPVCQSVVIRATANVALDWRLAAGASWLGVLPGNGRAPAAASLCATAGGLPAGSHRADVTITAASSNSPQTVAVTFTVTPAVAVAEGGVVSAAAPAPGQAIAAGQMLSVYGTNLAATTTAADSFPLPTELEGVRVQIGGLPARLLYVSPSQLNLVAPGALAGAAGSTTTLNLYNDRLVAPAVRVAVAGHAPGVFTALGTGRGAAAMTHADGSLVSRAAPLAPGEVFSVYLTGIGPLDPPVAEGEAAPAEPLARAALPVRLALDGQEAAVLYAGAAPGFAGLHVVVARAPEGLPRRHPEMVLEVGGVASNRTTAGGPSLLDVSPASVPAGLDATVVLRGINLALASAVAVGNERLEGAVTEAELQSLRVTIPARLLAAGSVALTVVDSQAPGEAASNPVMLVVER